MKKNILITIGIVFCSIFVYMFILCIEYMYIQFKNESMISYCSTRESSECYRRMFELMLPRLLIYDAIVNGVEIELVKLDNTTRVDALYPLATSNALIGYGVYTDTDYENNYSYLFNNYSYAFDCGVPYFIPTSPYCIFGSECIVSDSFLIFDHFNHAMQVSSGKVHTLEQKIKELDLLDKKVFIKIDVAESDLLVLPEIIKNADNILGFNIALQLPNPVGIIERTKLLEEINKKFILISRSSFYSANNYDFEIKRSKYYNDNQIINTRFLYLSFVNKNILDKYWLSPIQNTDVYYKKKKVSRLAYTNNIPVSDIKMIVYVFELFKSFFGDKK